MFRGVVSSGDFLAPVGDPGVSTRRAKMKVLGRAET